MSVFTENYKGVFGNVCKKCNHVHDKNRIIVADFNEPYSRPQCCAGVYPKVDENGKKWYYGICTCVGEQSMDFWTCDEGLLDGYIKTR